MGRTLASDIMYPHSEISIVSKLSTELLNRVLRLCVLSRPYSMALLQCRYVICSIIPKPKLHFFLGSHHCLTHRYGDSLWHEGKPLLTSKSIAPYNIQHFTCCRIYSNCRNTSTWNLSRKALYWNEWNIWKIQLKRLILKWRKEVVVLKWIIKMGRCVPGKVNVNMEASIRVPKRIISRGNSWTRDNYI